MASNESSEVGMCATCGFIASQRCGNCRKVFYCKRECQKLDWKKGHKEECRPYQISENPKVGRFLEATRSIKMGDIIFKDDPLVVGPPQFTVPLCLSCYKPVNGSYRCSKCTWPLCSIKCEQGVDHQPECIIGQEIGSPIDISDFKETNHFYELVTTLRALTLKKRNPKKFEQLLNLESHYEDQKGSQQYEDNKTRIVNMLRNYFFLSQFLPEVVDSSEEKIHRIRGIIDINGTDIQLSDSTIQAVYPVFSMMEHSCIPNVKISFNEKRQVTVKAATDIKTGDHLCISYTYLLWGTLARKEYLKTNKFFMCTCKRCSDASELGLNFSSLKCQNCPMGYLTSAAPLDELADWICSNCNNTIPATRAKQNTLDLGEEIEQTLVSPTVKSLENLLEQCAATSVHPNHFHLFAIRHTLLQMYGKDGNVDTRTIKEKESFCQEFLRVCTTLDPGMTRLSNYACVALYELHLTVLSRVRQASSDASSIKKDIEHAKALLKKCIALVEDEPEDQPEGQLCLLAKQNLMELSTWNNTKTSN